MKNSRKIYLFYPYVTEKMRKASYVALGNKIIGEGKVVKRFENKLGDLIDQKYLLSLNNGTSALELAFHLLDLKEGDEVISPVFTCTATNIPLVRRGVKIIFADIKENMMLDWSDVEAKINNKTKAVINVHLFNQLNENGNSSIPIIGDAAQYLGKTNGERFTAYSFQATKVITTVDGGALACKRNKDYKRARILRWYGINRETKKDNIDVDITESGYKYHMNNVTAAIGLAALSDYKKVRKKISTLQAHYQMLLKNINSVKPIGGSPFLIHTINRKRLMAKLAIHDIESGLVHKRNDIYSVFGGKKQNLPNMNKLEKTYLLLPCHPNMTHSQVEFIASLIKKAKL